MAKMIHAMLRVRDEAASLDFYALAFGLAVVDRIDFETFSLVYLANAETGFELELTINKGRERPYELGDGYGHMAFSVADIEGEHRRFTELGFAPTPVKTLSAGDRTVGTFFFVTDPDGYRIEVLARTFRFA